MYLSPQEQRRRMLRLGAAMVLALLAFVTIGLFDTWIWSVATLPPKSIEMAVEDRREMVAFPATEWMRAKDLYQVFRQAGYLPTWLLIAACVLAHDLAKWRSTQGLRSAGPWWNRATRVALGPTLAGLAAEALRAVIHRQRPLLTGEHAWGWPFGSEMVGPWGLPSSHAAVALGGAVVLMRLIPGIGWVVMPWAIGCGVSRVLVGAHFASDVFLGGVIGFVVAWALTRRAPGGPAGSGFPGPTFSLT
jgi:membrane-associated phospholipid phosphatase